MAKSQKNPEKWPESVEVVVTMPKGSRNRYSVLKSAVKVEKVFPLPSVVETGFISGTESDDGNPLTAFVLVDEPTFPGCIISARPVGVLKLAKKDMYIDLILLVPTADRRYDSITELEDVQESVKKDISNWFLGVSKMLVAPLDTAPAIQGWVGSAQAKNSIKHAADLFKRRH
ncbi:MAG: inorganic diphosphatase [archaeon]